MSPKKRVDLSNYELNLSFLILAHYPIITKTSLESLSLEQWFCLGWRKAQKVLNYIQLPSHTLE